MKLTDYKIDRNDKKWHLIDAKDMVFGRMCSEIATILMGKNKPNYTPLFDSGDYVVVINSKLTKFTGFKLEQKEYHFHSGYPGNLKTKTLKEMMEKDPEKVIRNAIRLMLPKTVLGRKMLKKLRVYSSDKHPHDSIEFVK